MQLKPIVSLKMRTANTWQQSKPTSGNSTSVTKNIFRLEYNNMERMCQSGNGEVGEEPTVTKLK